MVVQIQFLKKNIEQRNHKTKQLIKTNQNRKTLNRHPKTNKKLYPPNMQSK